MKIQQIAKTIVSKSLDVLAKYGLNKWDLALDYVDIFPKNEAEHKSLFSQLKKLGKPVFKTSTGSTYKLLKPIQTDRGNLRLLRVRDFDSSRTKFLGHPDYAASDYKKLKKHLAGKKNVNLIERDDYEMIEIWDDEFDVLVYFPNIPLSDDI